MTDTPETAFDRAYRIVASQEAEREARHTTLLTAIDRTIAACDAVIAHHKAQADRQDFCDGMGEP